MTAEIVIVIVLGSISQKIYELTIKYHIVKILLALILPLLSSVWDDQALWQRTAILGHNKLKSVTAAILCETNLIQINNEDC